MAFIKMQFKPGINREVTNYSQEGGWYSSNKVRFVYGFPKKIGGWVKYTVTAFVGVCRSLFVYSPSGANNFMAMGTSKKIYLDTGGSLTDITPLRLTTSAGDPRFTATAGSASISVAETSHGAIAGDYVTFSAAVSLGGLITAPVLNQEYVIDSITNLNAFIFTATATANASDTGDGGASTVAEYQINIGNDTATAGYGWGAGTWGLSTWGTARLTPIDSPMRLIFFTTYYDDLVFNVRGSDIYYWGK
jgi:hypothetical protein